MCDERHYDNHIKITHSLCRERHFWMTLIPTEKKRPNDEEEDLISAIDSSETNTLDE